MSPFLDLPLPRFVGLKNDSEARYSSGPAGGDGQGAAFGTGPVSWTPADRSALRQLEASTKKARTRVKSPPSPSSCVRFVYLILTLKVKNQTSVRLLSRKPELFHLIMTQGEIRGWCVSLNAP